MNSPLDKNSKAPLSQRPRRLRRSAGIRDMVRETELSAKNFVLPLFVTEGADKKELIKSMPGFFRTSSDGILRAAYEALELGVTSVALFPHLQESLKDSFALESANVNGLLQNTVRELKEKLPELCVITDVAMDPYSSDGHDGFVKAGEILNDETLEILAKMSLAQAEAGADFVAPSDMMDGRVGHIRSALDARGFTNVGIIAYSAKYASGFYGPFRDALDSAPRFGDKKTYQMDPANQREALREVALDIQEGADIVMVKPALSYLDIIARVKDMSSVPVAAYNVSGEYAFVKHMAQAGLIDHDKVMIEILTSIRRAGADIIFTYHALEAAKLLKQRS